jgi:hypothetical protein
MVVTTRAVVGLGFGKTFCLGLCKLWFLQTKLPFCVFRVFNAEKV